MSRLTAINARIKDVVAKISSTNVFEYGVEISIFDGVEISIVNSNVTMSRYMICYT